MGRDRSLTQKTNRLYFVVRRTDLWGNHGFMSNDRFISDVNLKDDIFYHDKRFAAESDGFEERIVTTYCGRIREYYRRVRERQLQRAMELVSQGKRKESTRTT